MTNGIGLVYTETETELLGPIRPMWSMMKTIQDNDMTDHAGAFYIENDIELSLLIGSSIVCDENETDNNESNQIRCPL